MESASVKDVVSNLKFIGELNNGDKINTLSLSRQPPGFMTSIKRTLAGNDNRHNTLHFLQKTLYTAFEIIETTDSTSMRASDKVVMRNLLKDVTKSKIGLSNLKETYASDLKFVCDIDTLIQFIDSKMEDFGTQPPPKEDF
jgi:hypothetical protein